MVEQRKLSTNDDYVTLFPTVSDAEFQLLKDSIKKERRLLMPVTINQDNVILDGHHRLRACHELGIPASYETKHFEGRPIDELEFVLSVNLRRRHLDEFQKSEVALKASAIAERAVRHEYTSAEAQAAVNKRYKQMPPEPEDPDAEEAEEFEDDDEDVEEVDDDNVQVPLLNQSQDTMSSNTEADDIPEWAKTDDARAKHFGVSVATMARTRVILEDGTKDQIEAVRGSSSSSNGKKGKAGVRTMYEKIQNNKVKGRLQAGGHSKGMHEKAKPKKHDNIHLINKDFRLVTIKDIPNESVDCVLALDFPEPQQKEDEWGRIHGQLMESATEWLKDGGILVMHVTKPYIPRVLCDRPPMLQYHDILCGADGANLLGGQNKPSTQYLTPFWRPYIVYVKGVRDIKPLFPDNPGIDVIASNPEDTKMTIVDYVARFVRKFSQSGATILDPFMGQTKGVVGEAVLDCGGDRHYIGLERDDTMFLTVLDRLESVE